MKTTRRENTNDNFQFASIVQGEFHVKVDEGTEGAKERVNKKGVKVWELISNEVEGVFMHSMEVKESEFGKQLVVFLRDSENEKKFFVIQVPLNSGYAQSILNRAANVDLNKEVKVSVFEIENEKDGKTFKTKTIVIYQNGEKVGKTWEGESNPVPKAEAIKDKKGNPVIKGGYPQFDATAKEEYLENYINDVLQVKFIEHLKDKFANTPKVETKQLVDADALTETDDLPF